MATIPPSVVWRAPGPGSGLCPGYLRGQITPRLPVLTVDAGLAHGVCMSAPKLHTEEMFMGRYKVGRELGRGGMGTVHLAYQIDLERCVALKRILPDNVGSTAAEGWFKREYRALAAIRHPGIPAIHDCGRSDDLISYFTMEMIEGPSLRTALAARKFDAMEAIKTAIELAEILAAAHGIGVSHRDVKPANIILEAGGRVRLIDFGICYFLPRFKARRSALRSVGDESFRTGPMETCGTVGYSDPALLHGHAPSVQSDIFSVCAVLYEMLAGRRLYDEKLSAFHPIDTAEFAAELMPVVAQLRRGCALLPKDRHASMEELIRSLEIARSGVTRAQDERASRPSRSNRRFVVAWSVVNATALALLAISWSSRRDEAAHSVEVVRAPAVVVPPTADIRPMPAVVERPAGVVPPPAEVLAPPAEVQRRAQAKPIIKRSAAPLALTRAQMSRAARSHDSTLRKCRQNPRPVNLDITVEAGHGELTRVEWIPYDNGDAVHRCFAREIAAVEFPLARSTGRFRLQVGH